jgi:hypothetical protein
MTADPWLACMLRGDFAGAWAISDRQLPRIGHDEWRRPRHLQRVWRGQPVAGQRVLVRCYHGLGDTLQFVRYLPMLGAVAGGVTLWVQPSLIPLVSSVPGIDRILPLHDGTPDVAFDVDLEIMELSHVFRSTLATLPRHVPYLATPPDAAPAIEATITPARSAQVAIAWRAGGWDPQRSLPVPMAAAMVRGLDCQLEVLQHTLTADERAYVDPAPPPRSIVQVARLLNGCDLVVTVDTVFAHLAGALGRPVWVLLPEEADWRWMKDRDDSPWYPTARLFRQRRAGDWQPVVDGVRSSLDRWLESWSARRRSQARPWHGVAQPGFPMV